MNSSSAQSAFPQTIPLKWHHLMPEMQRPGLGLQSNIFIPDDDRGKNGHGQMVMKTVAVSRS